LQGGGAHGAFTWGVLDRLLEERHARDRFAISGTSAGAMNAVVLASGYHNGGREGARKTALENFWRGISRDGRLSPIQRGLMDRLARQLVARQEPVLSRDGCRNAASSRPTTSIPSTSIRCATCWNVKSISTRSAKAAT
jgi:predicted acylesterase/phospholipase RssA